MGMRQGQFQDGLGNGR